MKSLSIALLLLLLIAFLTAIPAKAGTAWYTYEEVS